MCNSLCPERVNDKFSDDLTCTTGSEILEPDLICVLLEPKTVISISKPIENHVANAYLRRISDTPYLVFINANMGGATVLLTLWCLMAIECFPVLHGHSSFS